MSDLISRQWLMECVNEGWIKFDTEKDENIFIHLVRDIAPSTHPGCDEWCTDCKEYDKKKHSCPRWNRVIRQTVEELKKEQPEIIRCKDCQYWESGTRYGKCKLTYISVTGDYYCAAAAERRGE